MGRIDSAVIILHHFALFKPKLVHVKLEGVVVGNLDVQGNFRHLFQLGSFLVGLEIIQNRLEELGANRSSPVGRQDAQRHDIDAFFAVVVVGFALVRAAAAIVGFASVVEGFQACAGRTHHESVPIGKLAQAFALALRDVFIVFVLVCDGETRQIDLSQLRVQNARWMEENANE